MISTSTQDYINILEKTNQQLSLWYNPYGLMIGILTLLIALLALYFAYILWRQGRDYKDFLEEQKKVIKDETNNHAKVVLDEYIKSRDNELQTSTGEAREKIERELSNLKSARESLNALRVHPSVNTYGIPLTAAYSVKASKDTLSEAQIQSILALLQSFGADVSTIHEVNSALRG